MSDDIFIRPPRPLPVIVLADVSGSMAEHGKIGALTIALDEMARQFAALDERDGDIQMAVITFGAEEARLLQDLVPARDFKRPDLVAGGRTPLGAAFTLAREIVEDQERIPSRAYRPTLFLVSDGRPTDDWSEPLRCLLESERASKAFRLAIAIGEDADRTMLAEFLADPSARVLDAHDVGAIPELFQRVTMSVSRAVSSRTYERAETLDLFTGDDLDAVDL